jgi:hypothetical protein
MNESPRSQNSLTRTTAGILLFNFCCLLSSFRLIRNAPNPADIHPDVAQRSEQRFASLRRQLPARGVVGYIGESGNSGTEDYYLAQYELAPLVVERSPNHSLVVGSFPNSQTVLPENLQLVRDFGNGVLLLANKDVK